MFYPNEKLDIFMFLYLHIHTHRLYTNILCLVLYQMLYYIMHTILYVNSYSFNALYVIRININISRTYRYTLYNNVWYWYSI